MINPSLFAGFLAATLVIVLTPGPSVALATAQALRYGRRATFLTVAGDALGSAFHVLIATLGLGLLLQIADTILPWLQMLGGLYILYLAFDAYKSGDDSAVHIATPPSAHHAFWSGFVASVTNPKSVIFFIALFPAFFDVDLNIATQSIIYGIVFISLDAFMILFYAFGSSWVFERVLGQMMRPETMSVIGLSAIGTLLVVKGTIAIIA